MGVLECFKYIRDDFPLLRSKRVIYFDNAATSLKPEQVINAVRKYYEDLSSNVHRGVHTLSMEASRLYEEAHEELRKFINARYLEEVIFTSGTTQSLNLIAYMLGLGLNERDNVVISIMEHHSNLLPWVMLSKLRGFKLKVVDIKDDYTLDYEKLSELIDRNTRVVALTHMSNVLGTIVDIRRVSKIVRENDAFLVVDGAQSVPHIPISVNDLGIDFLAFSGHKMLGPTGIGVMYIRKEVQESLKPPFVGGGIVESVKYVNGEFIVKFLNPPWRFEPGTPNISGAIGLAEAVKYLKKLGMENVAEHEKELVRYTINKIVNDEVLAERLKIYGPRRLESRGGIISFNVADLNPHTVATFLDTYNIALRSGLHCAHPLHERIGASLGTVRASFYIYNTTEEVDIMIEALRELIAKLAGS
ncbi:MAG: cysteine desulfurase [Sulfolobales archaeon]